MTTPELSPSSPATPFGATATQDIRARKAHDIDSGAATRLPAERATRGEKRRVFRPHRLSLALGLLALLLALLIPVVATRRASPALTPAPRHSALPRRGAPPRPYHGHASSTATLPRIVTLAVNRVQGRLVVVWQVQNALYVWLQGERASDQGTRTVPRETSTVYLLAANKAGIAQGLLRLRQGDVTAPATPVALSPAPEIVLNPIDLDFGYEAPGTRSAGHIIHLVNIGLTPLAVGAVTVSGGAARDFTTHGTCAGATIGVDGGCAITVSFAPAANGARHAALIITPEGRSAPLVVPLSGAGHTPGTR